MKREILKIIYHLLLIEKIKRLYVGTNHIEEITFRHDYIELRVPGKVLRIEINVIDDKDR